MVFNVSETKLMLALVLALSRLTRTFSCACACPCAHAYACVVRLNQPVLSAYRLSDLQQACSREVFCVVLCFQRKGHHSASVCLFVCLFVCLVTPRGAGWLSAIVGKPLDSQKSRGPQLCRSLPGENIYNEEPLGGPTVSTTTAP